MKTRRTIWFTLLAAALAVCLLTGAALAFYDPGSNALRLGKNDVTINGDGVEFTFTPEEDGEYTIRSEGDADPAAWLYDGEEEIAYGDDSGEELNFCFTVTLEANTTYTLKIFNLDGEESDITVVIEKEESGPMLVPGENTVTIDGAGVYFSFTPAADGYYEFLSEGSADPEAWLYDGHNELAYSDNDVGNQFRIAAALEASRTYTLKIRNQDDEEAEITVTVRAADPAALSIGSHTVSIIEGGVFYAFTPEESGFYRFRSEGNADPKAWLYDGVSEITSDDDGGEYSNFGFTALLGADVTYGLRIANRIQGEAEITVYIEKIVPAVLTIGENQVTIDGGGVYFSFTPEEDGTYRFRSEADGVDPEAWLYDGIDGLAHSDNEGEGEQFRFTVTLPAGKTYTLKINNYDEEAAAITVFIEEAEIPALTIGENAVTIDGYGVACTFTPTDAGIYRFRSETEDADPEAWLYDGEEEIAYSDNDDGDNFRLTVVLEAGRTYTLKIRDTYEDVAAIAVVIEEAEISALTIDENQVTIDGAGVYCTFTPETDGIYLFRSEGDADPEAWLYDGEEEIAYNDDDGGGANFCFAVTLEGGRTYTLKIKNYHAEEEDINVVIKKMEPVVLVPGGNAVEIYEFDVYFTFTPTESGLYEFRSEGGADPEAWLYDGNEEIASGDNDDGDNFRLTVMLEAGRTYYLKVKNWYGEDADITVIVTPAAVFKTQNLILSGQIGVTFFMDLSGLSEDELADCYMTFSISGPGPVTAGNMEPTDENMSRDGKLYGFTCYVNSIQMADTITAAFHFPTDDGERTAEKTYSVEQYINDYDAHIVGTDDEDVQTTQLVHALANYGYYVQRFLGEVNHLDFDPETGYAEMTVNYELWDADDLPGIKDDIMDYGFSCWGDLSPMFESVTYSLTLDSETTIDIYFTFGSGYGSSVTVYPQDPDYNEMIDGEYEFVREADGRLRLTIPGIPAYWLGGWYSAVIGVDHTSVSIYFTALSYMAALLQSSAYADNADAVNAAAALYQYYTAAEAWIQNHA